MSCSNCPKCDSDLITVESSYSMRFSSISCDDCDYSIQAAVCEETLEKRWNKEYEEMNEQS
jgi:transposase-like protein